MLLGASGMMAQEIATWEDWCKSAVTFTFDDGANEWNSHNWGAQQLDKYGFKATFYVVTQWTGSNWNNYKGLAQRGHEIGSHTDSHNSNNSGELSTSKRTIEQNIGQPCLTIAYPNCNHMGNQVLSNYIGGRVCGANGANSKSPNDLSRFNCVICGNGGNGYANTQSAFTNVCSGANGGWAVFLIHGFEGLAGNGSFSPTNQNAFTSTLQWLDQNKKDYWVCSARDAIMYLKERDNASFKKISSDASSDTYSLTLNSSLTSNTVCKWDYPLSLRVPAQDGWSDIKVTQSDNEIECTVSGGYVYFKAVPGGGDIVVGSAAPAIPDPEFSFEGLASNKFCVDSTYMVKWTMNGDANDRTYTLNFGTGATSTEVSISNVSASSEWGETASNPYWTVDKILSDDGAHGGSSRWGSMTGTNEWVEFDLGQPQTVGGIMIDECTEYDVISSFEVQYDENGSWKTAYTGTKIGNDFKATFNPVTSSKMRLLIKEAGEGCNINYVEFQAVTGYVIKEGINASGAIEWKPNNAGAGMLTITNAKGKILTQTSNITVEECEPVIIDPTLNEDIEGDNAIVLMPNPADNYFEVKADQEIESISIINMMGQTLYSQAGGETVKLNVTAGTYMVKVITADGNISIQKLIVK